MKHKAMYIWWTIVLLLITAIFWGYHEGYIMDVWQKDVTYLTSVMSAILLYSVGVMGVVAWRITHHRKMGTVGKLVNRVWFLSEMQMRLAIIGTCIGIIMLLNVSTDINVSDQQALQTLLTHLWSNLGVAFYPNAVGMISGAVMMFLAHFITEDIE